MLNVYFLADDGSNLTRDVPNKILFFAFALRFLTYVSQSRESKGQNVYTIRGLLVMGILAYPLFARNAILLHARSPSHACVCRL